MLSVVVGAPHRTRDRSNAADQIGNTDGTNEKLPATT
jgi:hypothetical protein